MQSSSSSYDPNDQGAGTAEPRVSGGPTPDPKASATSTNQVSGEQNPNRPASETAEAQVSGQATSDLPTAEDRLGFRPYVESLRDFLIHPKTKPPLTLSIEGRWATGKSYFMEQLVRELEAKKKIVVRFNAWRHDKEDSLWAGFALRFIADVSKALTMPERVRAAVALRLRRYDWRAGWFRILLFILAAALFAYQTWFILKPQNLQLLALLLGAGEKPRDAATPAPNITNYVQVGGLAIYVAVAAYLVKKLKDFFVNPLSVDLRKYSTTPDYKAHSAFIEDFHSDFTRIVQTYAPRDRRIFVLIDDLDRCEIPKAADLMQAINLMLSDNDNLIFIIGMDREKVAAGLAVKYEKLLPFLYPAQRAQDGAAPQTSPAVGLDFGYEFIEKFIQLPFAIPQASPEDIKRLLAYLNGVTSSPAAHPAPSGVPDPVQVVDGDKDSNEIQEIALMVAESLDFNPRRIKHFINSFRLRTRLAAATGLFATPAGSEFDALTLHRLGKFVAISLRWPRLMSDLHNNRKLLSELQEIAWRGALPRPSDPVVSYWAAKPKL